LLVNVAFLANTQRNIRIFLIWDTIQDLYGISCGNTLGSCFRW
jgi:hypothetical protein